MYAINVSIQEKKTDEKEVILWKMARLQIWGNSVPEEMLKYWCELMWLTCLMYIHGWWLEECCYCFLLQE